MNITSYNISDVGYHYIGLKSLAGLPVTASRVDQTGAISRSILKYVSDKALRLMLPEPRGTFETVGEKVCQELVHFGFAKSGRAAYELTEAGRNVVTVLENRKYVELRRLMATAHLRTYDNLRAVVQRHLELGGIWRPIVDTDQIDTPDYASRLLSPTFKEMAEEEASRVLAGLEIKTPKRLEDALQQRILQELLPDRHLGVPLFRSICDRLVSLRLLNAMRVHLNRCEFVKSYSPCAANSPTRSWYHLLNVDVGLGRTFTIYLCEPDMEDEKTRNELLRVINDAFASLPPQAGYYDLTEVRDFVCERLRIPEASFDDGLNRLLDTQPSALTVGLQYEGISARRRPLVRDRGVVQIYNLIRRA